MNASIPLKGKTSMEFYFEINKDNRNLKFYGKPQCKTELLCGFQEIQQAFILSLEKKIIKR